MCSYYNTLFYRRTIGPWSFYKHKKAYELHSVINKYYHLILFWLEDVLKLLQVHCNILLNFFLHFPQYAHITSLSSRIFILSLHFDLQHRNFIIFFIYFLFAQKQSVFLLYFVKHLQPLQNWLAENLVKSKIIILVSTIVWNKCIQSLFIFFPHPQKSK